MTSAEVETCLLSVNSFDWLFIWSGNIFVIFCLGLIVSPYGKIRLGGADATADYSFMSWLSMLFAAGMGIGLMFWSVAEPDWKSTRLNSSHANESRMPSSA